MYRDQILHQQNTVGQSVGLNEPIVHTFCHVQAFRSATVVLTPRLSHESFLPRRSHTQALVAHMTQIQPNTWHPNGNVLVDFIDRGDVGFLLGTVHLGIQGTGTQLYCHTLGVVRTHNTYWLAPAGTTILMMFSDASSGGVAISEKNISVVAPMAIDTMTAKEKNLAGYKLWPGFKKSLT